MNKCICNTTLLYPLPLPLPRNFSSQPRNFAKPFHLTFWEKYAILHTYIKEIYMHDL